MDVPDPERDILEAARVRLAAGQPDAAAALLLRAARLALARDDLPTATRYHHAAMRTLGGVPTAAGVVPDLLLVESEVAAEAGDVATAARLSVEALEAFKVIGDEDGVLAAWSARAERALRGGNLAAAEEILGVLIPALDDRGDRDPGVWLRLRLAVALSEVGRRRDAEQLLIAAVENTNAGSYERMTVAAEAMRIWLDAGLARDAFALGVTVLDAPARDAREPHAEVLVLCAVALCLMGQANDATRFANRAEGFDGPGLAEARRRLARARESAGPADV